MRLFERFNRWIESAMQTSQPINPPSITDFNQKGRYAMYHESFDDALVWFERSESLAREQGNHTLIADAQLNRADVMIAMGKWDKAESLLVKLKEVLEQRKHRAPLAYALCSLGYLSQLREQWQQAQANYEQASDVAKTVQATGAQGRAEAHLADVYLHDGNASYALHLLKNSLPLLEKSGDTDLIAFFMGRMAKAYQQSGQINEASVILKKAIFVASAIHQTGRVRELHIQAGQHYYQIRRYDDALKHLRDAIRHFVEKKPDAVIRLDVFTLATRSSIRLSDLSQASIFAQQAVSLAKKHGDEDKLAMARALLAMTDIHDNSEQAIETITHYLNTYPVTDSNLHIDLLFMQGQAYELQDRADKAKDIYNAIVTNKASSHAAETIADAKVRLGNIARKSQEVDKAFTFWREAIQTYDTLQWYVLATDVQCRIAQLYWEIGDGTMARRGFERTLERLNQFDNDLVRGNVMAQVAVVYGDMGEPESAEGLWRDSLELIDDISALERLQRQMGYARFLIQIKDAKPAITLLMQIKNELETLNIKSNDNVHLTLKIKYLLGIAYQMLEQASIAQQYFDEIIDSQNQSIILETHLTLAKQYLNHDKYDEAKHHLTQIKTLDVRSIPLWQQLLLDMNNARLDQLSDDKTACEKLQKVTHIAKRAKYNMIYVQATEWSKLCN